MYITVAHKHGFFSCCSIILDNIVQFCNLYGMLPEYVDSSGSFDWYKPRDLEGDITRHYFEPEHKDFIFQIELPIDFHHRHQWKDYTELRYDQLGQLVSEYFTPTAEIRCLVSDMESRYQITDYENICLLFYRGNDKVIETKLCGYDEFVEKAREVQAKQPGIRFLIQSDETEFINRMSSEFPNSFYLRDDIRHMNKRVSSVDLVGPQYNYEFSKKYLAITIIMGKCKHIVCNTGNCSLWIMLYRGNADNVYQNFDGVWYTPKS
jgi:hypothetical protein